jgi:hypothetical protein
MAIRSKTVKELFSQDMEYLDIYVSYDLEALTNESTCKHCSKGLLVEQGFTEILPTSDLIEYYRDEYRCWGQSRAHSKKDLRVDCFDVPIEEARRYEDTFGFHPNSRIRLHFNGQSLKTKMRITSNLAKALIEEMQNFSLCLDDGSFSPRLDPEYISMNRGSYTPQFLNA